MDSADDAATALKDAAILFRAQRYEVGYEAAALLALKEVGRWKARATFTVQDVMKAMAKPPQENTEAITRARQASELFEELQWAIGLTGPSDQARLRERLALAFLGAPERLVWADKRASQPASFLGEALVEFPDDGYFVVALIMRAYDGLRCALFFLSRTGCGGGVSCAHCAIRPKSLATPLSCRSEQRPAYVFGALVMT